MTCWRHHHHHHRHHVQQTFLQSLGPFPRRGTRRKKENRPRPSGTLSAPDMDTDIHCMECGHFTHLHPTQGWFSFFSSFYLSATEVMALGLQGKFHFLQNDKKKYKMHFHFNNMTFCHTLECQSSQFSVSLFQSVTHNNTLTQIITLPISQSKKTTTNGYIPANQKIALLYPGKTWLI